MKRIIFTVLILPMLLLQVAAQYVQIPDANFRNYLQGQYPACFNANQEMDTTCQAVTTAKLLRLNTLSIASLEGLQYFDQLEELECDYNLLTQLPPLPAGLLSLRCHHNALTSLPALPVDLQNLYCWDNNLTSLPALPEGLLKLYCYNNALSALPRLPQSLNTLLCQDNPLTRLPALPAALRWLDCSRNTLQNGLPTLPGGVEGLYCTRSGLGQLPALPAGLLYLRCDSNAIAAMPALPAGLLSLNFNQNLVANLLPLPASLRRLRCASNMLESLPALPAGLDTLDCGHNALRELPELPAQLRLLGCGSNELEGLPALPAALDSLDCSDNVLRSLPALPARLRSFNCRQNLLAKLPLLPSGLLKLNCGQNRITALQALPAMLRELNCAGNDLYELPALPRDLAILQTQDNKGLSCLPLLPLSVRTLNIQNTQVTCATSVIPGIPRFGLPECADISATCATSAFLTGVVYFDSNRNGIHDPEERLAANLPIRVVPGNWATMTNDEGRYIAPADSGIVSTIEIPQQPGYIAHPQSQQALPLTKGLMNTRFDFAYRLPPPQARPYIHDLGVRFWDPSGFVRPGIAFGNVISLYNVGTDTVSGISLTVSWAATTDISFMHSGDSIAAQGNRLRWTDITLAPLSSITKWFYFMQMEPTRSLGTNYRFTVSTDTFPHEKTPANNRALWDVTLINSYDPNDKTVDKTELPPDYHEAQEPLQYVVRFQNTGTAPAIDVVIRDTLDLDRLDIRTLQILGASHPHQVVLRDKGLLEFVFPNIMLPDSVSNEPESHGMVSYTIQPKAGLQPGDSICNSAAIYFDFNEPVITNTTVTRIAMPATGIAESMEKAFRVHPQPFRETLELSLDAAQGGMATFSLYDLQGRMVYRHEQALQAGANKLSLRPGKLPPGLYSLHAGTPGGHLWKKVLRE